MVERIIILSIVKLESPSSYTEREREREVQYVDGGCFGDGALLSSLEGPSSHTGTSKRWQPKQIERLTSTTTGNHSLLSTLVDTYSTKESFAPLGI